jgi:cobyrinic acid a,c-diamide synthase
MSTDTLTVSCPALFLAAPASGQGKTTITAALARLLTRQGKNVHVFKTGPDYLDPQILEQASGNPVKPLDLWMAGDAWCQRQLFLAAQSADIILIEGAMGMFDGDPSSADLAARFSIPIAIVIDVKGMAQTAAAIATGLANFRNDITVAGLLANNCGSDRHRELIESALPDALPLLASLARSEDIALPERHLGLVQAEEVTEELEQRFEAGADWLEDAGAQDILKKLAPVTFTDVEIAPVQSVIKKHLNNVTIAIAKDAAFSFIYPSNIELLKAMGANIIFFSPLKDTTLPEADALWLPGGYPELHAETLSKNTSLLNEIQIFFEKKKPILAECGGFLYCLQTLTDLNDVTYPMANILSGHGAMRGKRGCQGMQTAPLPEGDVCGHAHHRSRSSDTPTPVAHGKRQRHPAPGEAIYRQDRLTATYLHLFFISNPDAIAQLFCANPTRNAEENTEENTEESTATNSAAEFAKQENTHV